MQHWFLLLKTTVW